VKKFCVKLIPYTHSHCATLNSRPPVEWPHLSEANGLSAAMDELILAKSGARSFLRAGIIPRIVMLSTFHPTRGIFEDVD
jgi:hypothetical protein